MGKHRNPRLRKVFCEIVEGAVYEDRCLFKLSQAIDGNPTCKKCILQELEALKNKKRIPGKKKGSRKPERPKVKEKFRKDKRFYKSQEVSDLLNIPLRTIQGWAKQGKISSKKIKRKLMFPKEEIDRLVEERGVVDGKELQETKEKEEDQGDKNLSLSEGKREIEATGMGCGLDDV